MSSFPRRSPRFQQQLHNSQPTLSSSFPSFSTTSSNVSSSHPSPTNNILNQPQQYPLHLQSQFLSPSGHFEAPLPSPSATDLESYMGNSTYNNSQMSGQSQQSQSNTSSFQNGAGQKQATETQNSQYQHHNSFSQPQRANYPPTSTNGVPPGLPPDFLAEAAKRAQMACLMRDLGDVSL